MYFHPDRWPSGWLKASGTIVGQRAFDVAKSALLELSPRPVIEVDPARNVALQREAKDAAQSYPLLVAHGHALVTEDSGKVARRTFVATDRAGAYFYIGIVPYAEISLHELSQALAKLPVNWDNVLNLDGGPSSGLAYRDPDHAQTIDSYVTIPNVLTVYAK